MFNVYPAISLYGVYHKYNPYEIINKVIESLDKQIHTDKHIERYPRTYTVNRHNKRNKPVNRINQPNIIRILKRNVSMVRK